MGSSRILSSLVFAAAFMLMASQTALAGREWCATDPIVEFANGARVQWVSQFYADYLGSLTGPVTYWIEVPENAGTITVSFPASVAREQVTISYTGDDTEGQATFTVRAYVTVNASQKFATYASVRGNVSLPLDVTGQSGTAMSLTSIVDRTRWSPLALGAAIVSTRTFTRTATTIGP